MKTTAGKGKILRIKHGYNPNSSSMGSIIFALPVSLMALSGGFVIASGLISSWFLNHRPDTADKKENHDPCES